MEICDECGLPKKACAALVEYRKALSAYPGRPTHRGPRTRGRSCYEALGEPPEDPLLLFSVLSWTGDIAEGRAES